MTENNAETMALQAVETALRIAEETSRQITAPVLTASIANIRAVVADEVRLAQGPKPKR